jgi:hypothetical protein
MPAQSAIKGPLAATQQRQSKGSTTRLCSSCAYSKYRVRVRGTKVTLTSPRSAIFAICSARSSRSKKRRRNWAASHSMFHCKRNELSVRRRTHRERHVLRRSRFKRADHTAEDESGRDVTQRRKLLSGCLGLGEEHVVAAPLQHLGRTKGPGSRIENWQCRIRQARTSRCPPCRQTDSTPCLLLVALGARYSGSLRLRSCPSVKQHATWRGGRDRKRALPSLHAFAVLP